MADLKASPLGFLNDNAVMASLKDTYASFSKRREELGLSNPGTVENIAKEVQKDVLLTNGMFTGFRADLTKVFNLTPIFRISHALSMGSQGNMPPYNLSTMYGSSNVSLATVANRTTRLPPVPKSHVPFVLTSSLPRFSCKEMSEPMAMSQHGPTTDGRMRWFRR